MSTEEVSHERIREIDEREDLLHIAGMIVPLRLGAPLFYSILEFMYYHPDTERNDVMIFTINKWMGMVWAVASIPITDRAYAEDACKRAGCRLGNGIPRVFGGVMGDTFPYQSKNTFTLANVSDHPAYSNDPELHKKMSEIEDLIIEEIAQRKLDPKKVTFEYVKQRLYN